MGGFSLFVLEIFHFACLIKFSITLSLPNPDPIFAFTMKMTSFDVAIIEDDSSCEDDTIVCRRQQVTRRTRGRSVHSRSSPNDANEFFRFPCSPSEFVHQRKRFLIFTRILIIYLSKTKSPSECNKVKQVVRDCARTYRTGHPSRETEGAFLMLMYSQLRIVVDEESWSKSLSYLRRMLFDHRCRRSAGRRVV